MENKKILTYFIGNGDSIERCMYLQLALQVLE